MPSITKNGGDEIASSEVSVSAGKGVRLSESVSNELADFTAEACDAILSCNGNAGPARRRGPAASPSRVDVFIAGNPDIRRLNREFRGKDKPTDVISFPAAEASGGGIAGDIAISASIAAENARRFGHAFAEELKVLILHGMLHLAGYDHETDRGQMERIEAALRRLLQLPGSLIQRESRGAGRPARRSRARRPRSAR